MEKSCFLFFLSRCISTARGLVKTQIPSVSRLLLTHLFTFFLSFSGSLHQQAKQAEVLGYGSTWFSLWLWKVMSADAFMHYTLISVFFGKLWVGYPFIINLFKVFALLYHRFPLTLEVPSISDEICCFWT